MTKNKAYKQCPLSLLNFEFNDVFKLLKYSLNSEMFSMSPMELMDTPNIWFEFSNILNKAEADYKADKGKN